MNGTLLVTFVCVIQANAFCQEVKTPNRTVVTTVQSENKETQGSSSSEESSHGNYPMTISVNRSGEQITHDKQYYQNQVVEIDETLVAIEVKIDYVKGNSSEHTLATQNGWYQDMEETKRKLREQRAELLLKIESFN